VEPGSASWWSEVAVNGGRRRSLDRRLILNAAVKLADREGLEALSMRRLGRELGVEAMSLYNHVPNKEALLNGMVEVLLEELEVPLDTPEDYWEERIRKAFRSYLRLARAHPNVFSLFALRPLNTAESLKLFELLREAGFDIVSALRAFRVLSSYTIGYALAEIRGFTLESDVSRPGVHGFSEEQLSRIFKSPPPLEKTDRDAEFEFGLDLILIGLRQYKELRSPRTPPEQE
jgi:AcrR family transcriptional regulator